MLFRSKLVADKLCVRLNIESCNLLKQLNKHEKESSTVIAPGIAIPHIIIEGEKTFDILLARCKTGIIFPDIPEKVDTIFVLVGTRDERNFHLRALASIAQLIQDHHFHDRWLAARSVEALRDCVLLGKRERK